MPAVWSQKNHTSWKEHFSPYGWSLDSLVQQGKLWCVEVSLDKPSWDICKRRCCIDKDVLKVTRSSPGEALDAAINAVRLLGKWPYRPEHRWPEEEPPEDEDA